MLIVSISGKTQYDKGSPMPFTMLATRFETICWCPGAIMIGCSSWNHIILLNCSCSLSLHSLQGVSREVNAHKELQESLVLQTQESNSLKESINYFETNNDQLVSQLTAKCWLIAWITTTYWIKKSCIIMMLYNYDNIPLYKYIIYCYIILLWLPPTALRDNAI